MKNEQHQATLHKEKLMVDVDIIGCSRDPVEEYDNLCNAFEGIRHHAVNTIMKWEQTFHDSEKYEKFSEKKIDELIQKAEETEKSLKEQKKFLKEKLRTLSKTLTLITENES